MMMPILLATVGVACLTLLSADAFVYFEPHGIHKRQRRRQGHLADQRTLSWRLSHTIGSCNEHAPQSSIILRNSKINSNDNNDDDGDDSSNNSSNVIVYTDVERTEMRELIVSLSLEATDHERRTRVKEIFYEALARPNGMPKRFTDLFDIVLSEVGEEVQLKAKKRFFETEAERRQQEQQQPPASSADDIEDNTIDEVLSEEESEDNKDGQQRQWKYPEEPQLWALVDVMVQSKTIVKKAEGTLGSKGTFQ